MPSSDVKKKQVFVRMNETERMDAQKNADKYAGGNLSRWLRARGTQPMLDVSIQMQDEVEAD